MSSFVVITNTIRRPLELVTKSIESSLAQDPTLNVVLVDQNEKPLHFSTKIEANPYFKHMHVVVPAVSMARNRAIYPPQAEWLIFCDDDGYMQADYFQTLKTLISANPEIEIFAGSIKRIDNQDFYSKRHAIGGDLKWFFNTKLLMGSNFVIRRKVFEELGKFDELFGAGAKYGSSEETDLAWNAFFNHKKMKYVPELVVFHIPPFTADTKSEVKKAFRYGIGKSALIRKWLLKGHPTVLYEWFEMFVVPFIKIPLCLIRLRFDEIAIVFGSLAGRIVGFFA